jgi:hypothetical protein
MQCSRTVNSSECIARGAALASAINSNIFKIHPYKITDISSENIIIKWKDL